MKMLISGRYGVEHRAGPKDLTARTLPIHHSSVVSINLMTTGVVY